MSRFLDALEEFRTGRRNAVHGGPLMLAWQKIPDPPFTISATDEYRFVLHWEVKVFCGDKHLKEVRKNVDRQIRREIYGDLIDRAIQIERAVYEQDTEKLLMHTRDLILELTP